jgi:hypothetical protein
VHACESPLRRQKTTSGSRRGAFRELSGNGVGEEIGTSNNFHVDHVRNSLTRVEWHSIVCCNAGNEVRSGVSCNGEIHPPWQSAIDRQELIEQHGAALGWCASNDETVANIHQILHKLSLSQEDFHESRSGCRERIL